VTTGRIIDQDQIKGGDLMQAKIMTLDETANGFLAWLNQKFNNTGPLPSIKIVCHPSEESWENLEAVQKAMERLQQEHLTKLVTGYKNWKNTGAYLIMPLTQKDNKISILAGNPEAANLKFKFLRSLYAGFGDSADIIAQSDAQLHLSPKLREPGQIMAATAHNVVKILEILNQKSYTPKNFAKRDRIIHDWFNGYMKGMSHHF